MPTNATLEDFTGANFTNYAATEILLKLALTRRTHDWCSDIHLIENALFILLYVRKVS